VAQISITFNGAQSDLDDFCAQYRYQTTIKDAEGADIPNPETKPAFFIRQVKEFVYGSVKSRRASVAGDAARQAEVDKIVSF